MEDFKIGDKVIFKKEVLDKIKKNKFAESLVGCSLYKNDYDCLIHISSFKELGYFEVQGFGYWINNLNIAGLCFGKDLFEHYREKCTYKEDNTLTIGDYKGRISATMASYFLNLASQSIPHFEACNELKKLFGENIFIDLARKCGATSLRGAFPEFESIEDLVNFVKELNKLLDSKKESDLTTTKNYQNNEIKFQRAKASCKRGIVPAGSTIRGRKDKIAISIGHLSYQVCNC